MSKQIWGPFVPGASSGGNGERSDDELLAELLNRLARKWVREHNTRPRDELGGLTPLQAHQLMYTEVGDPDCPLHLADDLREEEVDSSSFFRNARLFLATVEEMGGAKATQAGNLQRSFVAAILPRLDMQEWKREVIREFKVVNESDVGLLHRVRVVCKVGGLLSKRQGRFRLTRQAKGLLAGPSGALYRHLFFTYFYRYNIFYWWGEEYPEIQAFANFGLYRLGQLCRRWQSPKRITDEVYVKGLRMKGGEEGQPYPRLEWAVEGTFLSSLVEFGLLEELRQKEEPFARHHRYRVTRLFDRFLTFEWRS